MVKGIQPFQFINEEQETLTEEVACSRSEMSLFPFIPPLFSLHHTTDYSRQLVVLP